MRDAVLLVALSLKFISTWLVTATLVVALIANGLAQAPTPGHPASQTAPRATPARDRPLKGTAVLKGSVVDAQTGKPLRRARVFLNGPAGIRMSAQTDSDGAFVFRDLPPGKYTFDASTTGYLALTVSNGGKRPAPIELADAQTIERIVLRLSKGGVIAGQVLDEFGDPMPGADVRAARYRYVLGPGGFATAPGAPPGPWTIKAVLVGGEDVTDAGIDFADGRTVENIQLVYTRKTARLTGRVQDARGTLAQDAWVVVFPANESLWKPRSRYLRFALPDPEGTFRFMLVPSVDYLLIAVRDIEEGQWSDPDFLRSVKDLATRFSINEGESKTQDVKIVDWRK